MINLKINKQYKNEDSEGRKEMEERFSQNLLSSSKSNNNIMSNLKRSKTNYINVNNENSKFMNRNKTPAHKKKRLSLGIMKKFDEDDLR